MLCLCPLHHLWLPGVLQTPVVAQAVKLAEHSQRAPQPLRTLKHGCRPALPLHALISSAAVP